MLQRFTHAASRSGGHRWTSHHSAKGFLNPAETGLLVCATLLITPPINRVFELANEYNRLYIIDRVGNEAHTPQVDSNLPGIWEEEEMAHMSVPSGMLLHYETRNYPPCVLITGFWNERVEKRGGICTCPYSWGKSMKTSLLDVYGGNAFFALGNEEDIILEDLVTLHLYRLEVRSLKHEWQ